MSTSEEMFRAILEKAQRTRERQPVRVGLFETCLVLGILGGTGFGMWQHNTFAGIFAGVGIVVYMLTSRSTSTRSED